MDETDPVKTYVEDLNDKIKFWVFFIVVVGVEVMFLFNYVR